MAKRLAVVAVMVAMLFIPMLAKADSVWQYQGTPLTGHDNANLTPADPNYYVPGNCNCELSGVVIMNDNWQAVAWDFTAAGTTLTQANSTGRVNALAYVFDGQLLPPFEFFSFSFNSASAEFFSSKTYDIGESFEGIAVGAVHGSEEGSPGTWTEIATINTPEPGSLLLLGAGITALALAISLQIPGLTTFSGSL